jgi:succinyl-diaminopimelate desuccinylase
MDYEWVQQLACALIETPSPNLPGDERAMAGLITDAIVERGLPVPRIIAKKRERPNLLSTIDFGPGGRHLCLCGHMDTKPIGSTRWDTDPFKAVIADSRLYGLGACDMKSALAAMIQVAASVEGIERGRLSLLFTADEENMALYGSRFLAETRAVDADAIVIGEPGGIDDNWDHLHLVSRGLAAFTIKVSGDQGHSSLSDRRPMVNASVNMARLLVAFAEGFQSRSPDHPLLPRGTTVNPGVKISGGVNFGVFPGHAEFSVDVRTLPGMQRERFKADVWEWLREEATKIPALHARVEFEPDPGGWLPATEVGENSPVVRATAGALQDALGRVPPISAFPGTTDAAWLQGLAGIPTLPAVGPGQLERAHQANEFIDLEALAVSLPIYAGIVRRFCAEVPEPGREENV